MRLLAPLLLLAVTMAAPAAPQPFTGPDYSGRHGAYRFELAVPGYGIYPGQAASDGAHMAIHFALTDPASKDYGTGIATFRKTRDGRWQFSKWYYEPEFKGGNFGSETCTQVKPGTPASASDASR